jgi:hypothetical protein
MLERRRVVDSVAGHRHDLAGRLERVHEPQLLLRPDAREHVDAANRPGERIVAHRLERVSVEHIGMRGDPGLARDRLRRAGIVAGDHHDANSGAPALRDRRRNRFAHRVGQRDEAEKCEGHGLRRFRHLRFVPKRGPDRQQPQAATGSFGRIRERALLHGFVEPAQRKHRLGSSLDRQPRLARRRAPRVAHRAKFGGQRIVLLELPRSADSRRLGRGREDRAVHRIERLELARERSCFEQRRGGYAGRRPGLGEHHAVLSQGPGLVDAQHGRSAEHLDGRHVARQHAAPADAPGAEREKHRQHHRELLRQDRHRERKAGEDRGERVAAQREVQERYR